MRSSLSRMILKLLGLMALLTALLIAVDSNAQTLSGPGLQTALQKGGYVIVMRHASSPRTAPGKSTANADNPNLERQLDATGKATAIAMGKALRELKIPVGSVLSSPTYRALETARLAQLPTPKTYAELGDGGESMQTATGNQVEWLQKQVAQFPKTNNTFIVTHMPNIGAAFPQLANSVADGEALVFGSDGKGGAELLARIKIEDWPKLGVQ